MNKTPPSIFNHVIGPVMRGPSSSHCAAALRIGLMCRAFMGGRIDSVLCEFHPEGSLANTHESQGSDMGLCGGLLGYGPEDERLPLAQQHIADNGTAVTYRISNIDCTHPNAYQLTLTSSGEAHVITCISAGGGAVEIVNIDGTELSISGDYRETLIFTEADTDRLAARIRGIVDADYITSLSGPSCHLVRIQSQTPLSKTLLDELKSKFNVSSIREMPPVMPVMSRRDMTVPFSCAKEMFSYSGNRDLQLWELAVEYESSRGGINGKDVVKRMKELLGVMQAAIEGGLAGTQYEDRILPCQSAGFRAGMDDGKLLDGGILNQITLFITALMESKSAMKPIVAAPTAGSCAALPATCIAAARAMNLSDEETARALLAAGLIGVFIAEKATFAAELGGCQAECGSASGMAAAALVTLMGGSTDQAVNAASMALQNVLGMVCDPVANRVEVPCLGKNVMAASNAFCCANMALSNFDPVIPFDEVIEAMRDVGASLPPSLRCTAKGGLSLTPTAKCLDRRLNTNG